MRVVALVLGVALFGSVHAQGIGTIRLTDGHTYPVLQLGDGATHPDYFVRANKRFIALARVRQIARVGVGLINQPAFEIFLDNGERVRADVGTMWYQRNVSVNAENGQVRENFSAVMKERDSSGLLLIVQANGEPKNIELADPNAFLELVIHSATTDTDPT